MMLDEEGSYFSLVTDDTDEDVRFSVGSICEARAAVGLENDH